MTNSIAILTAKKSDLAVTGMTVDQRIAASIPENTLRAYDTDWKQFTAWLAARGVTHDQVTPVMVGEYLNDLANDGKKYATIARARAAIGKGYGLVTDTNPAKSDRVRDVMKAIARTIGKAQTQATAVIAGDVQVILNDQASDSVIAIRNRAIIALGFAIAARRSELASLDIENVKITASGSAVITIAKSKTDQEGKGYAITVRDGEALKPVSALLAWLQVLAGKGIESGKLFRSVTRHGVIGASIGGKAVRDVIANTAAAKGMKGVSGHSLRRGYVTSAFAAGDGEVSIQKVSRHKNISVLSGYNANQAVSRAF